MFILEKIASILFPEICVVCNKTPNIICRTCVNSLDKIILDTNNQDSILSVFSYSDARVKKLIWGLKYENKKSIAEILSGPIYEKVLGLTDELVNYKGVREIFVVPIPLHSSRLRDRGYNQSLLLASKLCSLDISKTCILASELLSRSKTSIPNAKTHSRERRFKNTKGSFRANSKINYAGKTILLIDDVYTTGATLFEARRTLLNAGALNVYSITLAH